MIPSRSYSMFFLLLRLLYENVRIHECEQTFNFLIDQLLSRLLWKHEFISLTTLLKLLLLCFVLGSLLNNTDHIEYFCVVLIVVYLLAR